MVGDNTNSRHGTRLPSETSGPGPHVGDCLHTRVGLRHLGRFLNSRQVAQIIGMHEDTVRNMLIEGRMPAYRLGGRWRVDEYELNRWLEQRRHGVEK